MVVVLTYRCVGGERAHRTEGKRRPRGLVWRGIAEREAARVRSRRYRRRRQGRWTGGPFGALHGQMSEGYFILLQ